MRKLSIVAAATIVVFTVLTFLCQIPLWVGLSVCVPVFLATLVLRLYTIAEWPQVANRLVIPVGLAGGCLGALLGPIGFVIIMAFANPYIPGARDGLLNCFLAIPVVVCFGTACSYMLNYAFPVQSNERQGDDS